MKSLKKELVKKCKSLGISLVGFAPVERWKNPPDELPNKLST
jgi:epoxyqueuosine reductase